MTDAAALRGLAKANTESALQLGRLRQARPSRGGEEQPGAAPLPWAQGVAGSAVIWTSPGIQAHPGHADGLARSLRRWSEENRSSRLRDNTVESGEANAEALARVPRQHVPGVATLHEHELPLIG